MRSVGGREESNPFERRRIRESWANEFLRNDAPASPSQNEIAAMKDSHGFRKERDVRSTFLAGGRQFCVGKAKVVEGNDRGDEVDGGILRASVDCDGDGGNSGSIFRSRANRFRPAVKLAAAWFRWRISRGGNETARRDEESCRPISCGVSASAVIPGRSSRAATLSDILGTRERRS